VIGTEGTVMAFTAAPTRRAVAVLVLARFLLVRRDA
jgi:hypothetical protein